MISETLLVKNILQFKYMYIVYVTSCTEHFVTVNVYVCNGASTVTFGKLSACMT